MNPEKQDGTLGTRCPSCASCDRAKRFHPRVDQCSKYAHAHHCAYEPLCDHSWHSQPSSLPLDGMTEAMGHYLLTRFAAEPAQPGQDTTAEHAEAAQGGVPEKCPQCGSVEKERQHTVRNIGRVSCPHDWHSPAPTVPARPETAESLAVDIARELYDRFVMGGWSPEEAHDYLRDILHGYAESRVKEARRDSEILRHGRIVKLARMRKMFVCSECGAMLSQGPHSPDCSAATPEDECKRCHRTMLIRDDVVPNYRPKSKQPKSRKRKKADK